MRIINRCSKHGRVRFLRKTFFRPKIPEIAVFAHFHWTFSVFCLFFFTKNIVNSNSQYFAKIVGTADYRPGKTSNLQFLESCSIFHSWISALFFRLLFHSFARSFVCSFVFQYLFHCCLYFLYLSKFHHQVGPISI